jgi:homocysteine S-methyltransferase
VHHVQALVELLTDEDVPIPAWISFNSKDGTNVVKGDSFDECVGLADKCKKIVAVGVNCTPPRFIHDLICTVRKATLKPILVYPNSGEQYDPSIKQWVVSLQVSAPPSIYCYQQNDLSTLHCDPLRLSG